MGNHVLGLKEVGLGVGLWGKIKKLKKGRPLYCDKQSFCSHFVLKSAKGAKKGDLGIIIYNQRTCELC